MKITLSDILAQEVEKPVAVEEYQPASYPSFNQEPSESKAQFNIRRVISSLENTKLNFQPSEHHEAGLLLKCNPPHEHAAFLDITLDSTSEDVDISELVPATTTEGNLELDATSSKINGSVYRLGLIFEFLPPH